MLQYAALTPPYYILRTTRTDLPCHTAPHVLTFLATPEEKLWFLLHAPAQRAAQCRLAVAVVLFSAFAPPIATPNLRQEFQRFSWSLCLTVICVSSPDVEYALHEVHAQ